MNTFKGRKILFNYITGMVLAIIIIGLCYGLLGHKIIELLYKNNLWMKFLMKNRKEWPLIYYFQRYDGYFMSLFWAMGYLLILGILFIFLLKLTAYRHKKYLIYFLALIIIIFSIIGFELGVRSYFRHRGFYVYLTPSSYNSLPYLVFGDRTQRLNLYNSYKNIYEIGLKASQNYPIKKRQDTFRIFFLGGSVAADIEKENVEKRYYAILEKKLNNYTKGRLIFECISAGVGGYISNQELIWLEFSGLLDMDPNLIVIFDGYNDVVCGTSPRPEIGYPYSYNHSQKQLESIPYYLLTKVSRYSAFLRYILTNSLSLRPNSSLYKGDKELSNLIAINYVKNIEKICALTNSLCPNTKIIIALQPALIFKKPLSSGEKIILSADIELQSFLKETYPVIFEHLKSSAPLGHKNISIIDLTNVFDSIPEEIYYDPCHFGEKGSIILAENFYNLIKDKRL